MVMTGCILLPKHSIARKGAGSKKKKKKMCVETNRKKGSAISEVIYFTPPGQTERTVGKLPKVQTSVCTRFPSVDSHFEKSHAEI